MSEPKPTVANEAAPKPAPYVKPTEAEKLTKGSCRDPFYGSLIVIFSICIMGLTAAVIAQIPDGKLRSALIFNLVIVSQAISCETDCTEDFG